MKAIIAVQNISKTYGEGTNKTVALDRVNLKIGEGEFVAIIGPSGSGKSTLMHILGCLDRPTSGKYFLEGKLVSALSENELARIRNEQIGFVFQSFNLLPRTKSTNNVLLPLIYSKVKPTDREGRAKEMLESVGLGDKLNSLPNQLSGGQMQRVAIARALVNKPVVILADEPTGNLDSRASDEIIEIFKKLNREGRTIVMITHEREVARQAKRIVSIRDGMIVSDRKVK